MKDSCLRISFLGLVMRVQSASLFLSSLLVPGSNLSFWSKYLLECLYCFHSDVSYELIENCVPLPLSRELREHETTIRQLC